MTYTITKRERPKALQRRKKLMGFLPIGPKQDYARPWAMLRDGKPIGFYLSESEARAALPPGVTA